MHTLIWQDPPKPMPVVADPNFEASIRELVARPGEWARIYTGAHSYEQGRFMQTNDVMGKPCTFYMASNPAGGVDIYARAKVAA